MWSHSISLNSVLVALSGSLKFYQTKVALIITTVMSPRFWHCCFVLVAWQWCCATCKCTPATWQPIHSTIILFCKYTNWLPWQVYLRRLGTLPITFVTGKEALANHIRIVLQMRIWPWSDRHSLHQHHLKYIMSRSCTTMTISRGKHHKEAKNDMTCHTEKLEET